MNTRLQEINLTEFTGGFNAWRNQFNLAANESPDMLNMDVDPRGGFYTRKGWTRWNAEDVILNATINSTWNFVNDGVGLPSTSGNAIYTSLTFTSGTLEINDSDSDAVDQSTPLSGLGPGDVLYIGPYGTASFTITTATDWGTYWSYAGVVSGVLPADGEVRITDTIVGDWEPRNTFAHSLSTGSYVIYVTNDGQIENAGSNGVFSTLQIAGPTTIAVTADPHLADFAAWGDYLYIACGSASASHLRNGTGTPTAITDAYGNYNDDYTTPDAIGAGAFPRCDFIETHSSYVFAAYTKEGTVKPNRLRWSHPSQPENWATLDYIDIDAGGGKITGLRSFQDHLLIFKTDSVWALYGYDSDSWQLVRVSTTVGAPNTTAVTSSESAVYFYSTAMDGGIYAYDGNSPIYISENLRTITEEISATAYDDIWLGWVGKRLWCSLPWLPDGARAGDEQTVFVFDPRVGNGAWVVYRPASGSLTSIVENSDVYTQNPLAVVCGHASAACLVQLDYSDSADDKLVEALTADPFEAYYTTGWQNAGWLERRKSWRRPRFILERVDETVQINLDTYFDYNESAPMRSHTILVNADGTAFWRLTGSSEAGGFDWGDGTLWGASGAEGSTVERAVQASATLSGLGVNKAIQMRFSTNPNYLGRAWGINAMTLKYILRRFTT